MKLNFEILIKGLPEFDSAQYDSDPRWKLLGELYDMNYKANASNGAVIPKKIHQIWLGSEFPEKYRFWADTWKRLNPDYEYKLWTDKDVPGLHLPNEELYNSISNYGIRSDILRYHILNKFGGIYADTDFECLKPFSDLERFNFFIGAGYPSKVELYPGLIGCIPDHPIMRKVVEEVDKVRLLDILKRRALETTGSYFFTRIFFDVVKKYEKGIVALPPCYLYPYPNHERFRSEDSSKFIKRCSYAIHYWEVSWNKLGKMADWVQGDKFTRIADSVFSPRNKTQDDFLKLPNTFDPSELQPINFIYTNITYLAKLLRIVECLPNKFVLVSHNGDSHIEKDGIVRLDGRGNRLHLDPYSLPENVLKVYSVNVNTTNERIVPIPIGLESDMWRNSLGKKRIIDFMKSKKADRSKLLYINHNVSTCPPKRQIVYDLLSNKKWVTSIHGKNGRDITSYFDNLVSHKFMACPEGNGLDTHRVWECLYVGCIPIVIRNEFSNFYQGLPVCFVNSWQEVSEEFLNKEYERICSMDWDKDVLEFSYWRNKIRTLS